jgi:hypothetical protein
MVLIIKKHRATGNAAQQNTRFFSRDQQHRQHQKHVRLDRQQYEQHPCGEAHVPSHRQNRRAADQ